MTINNLSSILLAALFIISTVSTSVSFSQEEVILDSIHTGGKYRITTYNDKEVIGKVIKQDSVYLFITTEEGTVRIRHEDVFSVSKTTMPRLIKALLSLGGGIYLQSGDYGGYRETNKPGYTFNFSAAYPFSENKAIRLDLSYSRLKRDAASYSYYYNPNGPGYSTQNVDVYSAYVDFVFGNFTTNDDFSVYGIAGIGLMHVNEGEYQYTDYYYYDTTYTYTTRTYPGFSNTNFSMAIGGGMRFKVNNRLGAFLEAQYNMTTYEGFFWFFGRGYFPIRAGVTYTFY
ncbi:MAG: outer membrane beta-barrel protein [Ignavibacteria bacterium]|nr:outer membrane beta-barrel protein [Ignavibacteria bacterium]